MRDPEEACALLHGQRDGLPAVIVVNQSFARQHAREDHPWHLSVILDPRELGDNGMPASPEGPMLYEEGDRIQAAVSATGEARFLARVTWNGTRQLLFRVGDPEPVHAALQRLIAAKTEVRDWDYEMWSDPEWESAAWFVSAVSGD